MKSAKSSTTAKKVMKNTAGPKPAWTKKKTVAGGVNGKKGGC